MNRRTVGERSLLDQSVWKRTDAESPGGRIGDGTYNLVIGLTLCWGFLVNWLIVENVPYERVAGINPWIFLIGYFVSSMIGIFIYSRSDNPAISFLGYNFVVLPFGLVVNLAVHQYDPEVVGKAIRTTGFVTASMMGLGTIFPAFFQRIERALGLALLLVIIWQFVGMFFFRGHSSIIDWVVVVIFCGYIGADWARANRIPKTVDNAIDSAAALYMDIIILFLRLLRIFGRGSRS